MLLHDDEAGGATRIGDGTTTQTAAALLHPARFLLALLDNNNANNNAGVAVTIDVLTVVLVSSAACYGMCFRLARRKLQMLHAIQPQLTTKKLLLLSVLFSTVLRIMTILGVAAMNMANVRAHYSLQPSTSRHRYTGDKTQSFYDEAMTVLFDLPNCIVVSTYVLLTLVWAECFLEARFHTENALYWKRRLLIGFMIFNTCLYATQLILYACIFFSTAEVVRVILYAAITGISFTAVMLVLVFYVYLNIRFSGFPFRSEEVKASFTRVSTVMTLWSLTRVIWGIATLLVYVHNVELLQDTDTPFWSFVILFVIFVVCEIVPIVILLDYSYYMNLLMRQRGDSENIDSFATSLLPANSTENNNNMNNISLLQPNRRAEGESDSLLLQRPLHNMDQLLLTSPRITGTNTASSNSGGETGTNNNHSRRVHFQDDLLFESL